MAEVQGQLQAVPPSVDLQTYVGYCVCSCLFVLVPGTHRYSRTCGIITILVVLRERHSKLGKFTDGPDTPDYQHTCVAVKIKYSPTVP